MEYEKMKSSSNIFMKVGRSNIDIAKKAQQGCRKRAFRIISKADMSIAWIYLFLILTIMNYRYKLSKKHYSLSEIVQQAP